MKIHEVPVTCPRSFPSPSAPPDPVAVAAAPLVISLGSSCCCRIRHISWAARGHELEAKLLATALWLAVEAASIRKAKDVALKSRDLHEILGLECWDDVAICWNDLFKESAVHGSF
jgi:hypothetical protein